MKELFDPANFVWIIPLCAFGAFIICATCFVLRKEIRNMFKKLLFPYKNRYSIPAGIITKDTENKIQSQNAPLVMSAEIPTLPPTPLLFNPLAPQDSSSAKADTAQGQETESAKAEDKPLDKPKTMAAQLRVFIKDFNAILFPQSQSCFSPKEDLEKKALEQKNATIPPLPPVPVKAEEPVNEPQKIEEEKPQIAQEEKPQTVEARVKQHTQLPILPIPVLPAHKKEEHQKPLPPAYADAKAPYFIKDRYIIILSLLILSGFVIFLTARVKLLSAIQQRQYIEIKQLKEQLLDAKDAPAGKKVIIYVPVRRK